MGARTLPAIPIVSRPGLPLAPTVTNLLLIRTPGISWDTVHGVPRHAPKPLVRYRPAQAPDHS